MPMLGLIAAALNCGDDAGLGAKTITLSFSQNNNYHYTYDPAAESPALDGYNAVSVDVEVDVDDRYDDGYSDGYNAGYTAGQSSVPIEPLNVTVNDTYEAQSGGYSPVVVNVPQSAAVVDTKSVTENGTYTAASESPPLDGYSVVTVDVPTYEHEVKELEECKALMVALLQSYMPTFNPQTCSDIIDGINDLYQEGVDDGTGGTPKVIPALVGDYTGSDQQKHTVVVIGTDYTGTDVDSSGNAADRYGYVRDAVTGSGYSKPIIKIIVDGTTYYANCNAGGYYTPPWDLPVDVRATLGSNGALTVAYKQGSSYVGNYTYYLI